MKDEDRKKNLNEISALVLKLKREHKEKHKKEDPYIENIRLVIKAFDDEQLSEENERKFISYIRNAIFVFFKGVEKKGKKSGEREQYKEHKC